MMKSPLECDLTLTILEVRKIIGVHETKGKGKTNIKNLTSKE